MRRPVRLPLRQARRSWTVSSASKNYRPEIGALETGPLSFHFELGEKWFELGEKWFESIENWIDRAVNSPLYEKLINFERVFTMRKFLLVTLMGMALAIYLYGIVNKIMVEEVKPVDHVKETATIVYME